MFDKKQKQFTILNKIFETLQIGSISNYISLTTGDINEYKVETIDNSYHVIEYNKKIIPNNHTINLYKIKLGIMEKLSCNGVPIIMPLKFENKFFILYRTKYYLIYKFAEYEKKDFTTLNNKNIKKIANTLAIIHKLNIKSPLPYINKKIDIDLNKILIKYKKINDELYQTLYDNYFIIEDLLKKTNENLKYINESLCVNYKDYDLNNILWKKDYMYLKDFNLIEINNPIVALIENAFYYSENEGIINEKKCELFITNYLKKYGPIKIDYRSALYIVPLNLIERLKNIPTKDQVLIDENINIIKRLCIYYKNIDLLKKIITNAVK